MHVGTGSGQIHGVPGWRAWAEIDGSKIALFPYRLSESKVWNNTIFYKYSVIDIPGKTGQSPLDYMGLS